MPKKETPGRDKPGSATRRPRARTTPAPTPDAEAPKLEARDAPARAQAARRAAAAAAGSPSADAPTRRAIPIRPGPRPRPIPSPPLIDLGPTLEILRPDDLLSIAFNFLNLKLDTSDLHAPKLVISDKSKPAYLIAGFGPQSVLEQAYFETATITSNSSYNPPVPVTPTSPDALPAAGTTPAYIAGPSRLVFQVPADIGSIAYTIEGLIDWSKLQLVASPTALGDQLPPPITQPTQLQTAIEIPWRVVLSPGKGVGWAHASQPETFAGRTALWHTRLASAKVQGKGATAKTVLTEASEHHTLPLRVIWSDDFTDHGPLPGLDQEVPFRASLDPHDRMQLVILTSGTLGYAVVGGSNPGGLWTPIPVNASRLFLSALGGYLSSRGEWPFLPTYTDDQGDPQALDLIEWDHEATLGRDQYVRVVYAGYLYPFGHAATLIKVTERKFVPPDGGNVTQTTAFLRQRMYIHVREPLKSYKDEPYVNDGREMPFWQSVRIKTLVTPDIDIPEMLPGGHNSFWVEVGGEPFQFHIEAVDLKGNKIDFLAPLIFMAVSENDPAGVQTLYAADGSPRACTVNGSKIAFADPNAGDTTLRTTQLNFTTQLLLTQPPYPIAPFLPCLDNAIVTVPVIEQILGNASPVLIELYSGYLQNNLDPYVGVYASVISEVEGGVPTGAAPVIAFSAHQSGGFATPVLALSALSAKKGLLAGQASDAVAGNVDPTAFFDLSAKLFGEVPLSALVKTTKTEGTRKLADVTRNAPEIRSALKPNAKAPTSEVATVQWAPDLMNYENDPVRVHFDQNGQTSALTLKATLTRSLVGAPPTSEIQGQLTNFALILLGVIELTFVSLKFTSTNGQKMDVKAKLVDHDPIAFTGALAFLQTLADILPPGIFGKGPSVDLEPSQIVVSYSLGLPPIGVGVFSLEHISITTGLDLPYLDGQPGFEFAFAKRNSPFLLTVECLGGGGFVHLIVNASGVQMVEGALEFGGEFSFSVGVASGGVHVMAGIYFQLSGTTTIVAGFVDIGGEVSVLGIISISMDLNLSLAFEADGPKDYIKGKATLTISVHVVFFSIGVSVSVEKSFAANPGDPRIGSVLTEHDWSQYAAAFAA
jgi:hypothetical protein